MLETVLGQTSMTVTRSYIDTRPPDEQGELCELMVREIMRDILLTRRSTSPDPFSEAKTIEGRTINNPLRCRYRLSENRAACKYST